MQGPQAWNWWLQVSGQGKKQDGHEGSGLLPRTRHCQVGYGPSVNLHTFAYIIAFLAGIGGSTFEISILLCGPAYSFHSDL